MGPRGDRGPRGEKGDPGPVGPTGVFDNTSEILSTNDISTSATVFGGDFRGRSSNNDVIFKANDGTQMMRIFDANQRIVVGTDTSEPSVKMLVNGSLKCEGSFRADDFIRTDKIKFGDNGDEILETTNLHLQHINQATLNGGTADTAVDALSLPSNKQSFDEFLPYLTFNSTDDFNRAIYLGQARNSSLPDNQSEFCIASDHDGAEDPDLLFMINRYGSVSASLVNTASGYHVGGTEVISSGRSINCVDLSVGGIGTVINSSGAISCAGLTTTATIAVGGVGASNNINTGGYFQESSIPINAIQTITFTDADADVLTDNTSNIWGVTGLTKYNHYLGTTQNQDPATSISRLRLTSSQTPWEIELNNRIMLFKLTSATYAGVWNVKLNFALRMKGNSDNAQVGLRARYALKTSGTYGTHTFGFLHGTTHVAKYFGDVGRRNVTLPLDFTGNFEYNATTGRNGIVFETHALDDTSSNVSLFTHNSREGNSWKLTNETQAEVFDITFTYLGSD